MLFGRAQLVEQVERLVNHPIRTRTGAVDLVNHHDGAQAHAQRLFRHKTGLRHRAFHGIHQQQHAVHHTQHALHLTAKVRMAGGIDDIDVRILVIHRAVLGQNGNAALLFQIIVIHDPLGHLLVRGKGTGLSQQLIHQRGFTVVNVGDNGDITKRARHGCGLTESKGGAF